MGITKKEIIPSLSGFQYSYNTIVIAGALIYITPDFQLTQFQEGMVVAVPMIGTCLASFSAILANSMGRKKTLFLSTLFLLFGILFSGFSVGYYSLLLGRFLVGVASGIFIVVAPLYLVEVSSYERRGSILNLNQLGNYLGQLVAYLINYLFSFGSHWRWMFLFGIIFNLIQGIGLFFIPESIPDTKEIQNTSWRKVLEPSFRSRLVLIFLLILFQALCGSTAIGLFAPRVFQQAGFVEGNSFLIPPLIVGVVSLLVSFASFILIDRKGRRSLLVTSYVGMAIPLLAVSFFYFFSSPLLETVSFLSIIIYYAFYAFGVGPVPPLVIGEISPLAVRGHVMFLMGFIGWVTNYILALGFLPLLNGISIGGLFLLFALFCILGAFTILFMPETKQKKLDEIETLFKK